MAKSDNVEQNISPELKEYIAKLIAEAKAEAKEEAKAEAAGKRVLTEEEQKAEEYWNELVEIQLFKDSGKYQDDVYVAVNGENCLIQRGKPVKVKRKFAEVLKQSLEQDNNTADMIRELEGEYEKKSKELN